MGGQMGDLERKRAGDTAAIHGDGSIGGKAEAMLFFDEVLAKRRPPQVDPLKNEILTLQEKGSTIIFSTHNMSSVEELCDHITLIDKGRTLLEGPIEKIREQYRTDTYEGVSKETRNS